VEARFSAPVQTGPGAHPASLYNWYRVFPGGKERPGRDAGPSPPSSAVGHVELYLYSPFGPYGLYRASVPVQGCTLPLPLPLILDVAVSQKECGWGKLHVRLWLKHCFRVTVNLQPPCSEEGGFANTDGRFRLATPCDAKRLELCLFHDEGMRWQMAHRYTFILSDDLWVQMYSVIADATGVVMPN
jgi:hypothetical protein